jgi:hypothetical protein
MFKVTKKSMQWGNETLTLETGKVARQADGSVIATLGETSVMANVTFAKQAKPGQDFFPLTVHYQERYYAAGKMPGRLLQARGASDREGNADLPPDRPSDPAAVRRRLQERGAGDLHRAEPRPRQRSRHRGDDRGLGRTHHLGRALHGPDRGLPRRLLGRRVCPEPRCDDMHKLRRTPSSVSTSSSPAPRTP